MEDITLNKIAREFNEKLFALIAEEVSGAKDEELAMKSAIILKTAIEMYVMQFDDDIHIENLLKVAAKSIPLIREKIGSMPLTVH